ncbi:hypothetical protein XENTR_v10013149 [Xenopus tropicalis]|nr:hypothetical protein XENTR_v10013149 [Xenopus tropicalis]
MPQTSDPLTFLLQERDIKQDSKEYSYREIAGYTESWPVCPVPAERGSYAESSDAPLVQEKPRPIVLLIPQDIRCDSVSDYFLLQGLLCPIPPIESQLTNPELSSAILQDFLPIVPYIQLLVFPTENKSTLTEELMDLFSLEKFIVLLDLFCLYWCYKKSSKKTKDGASAETESDAEPSPIIQHQSDEAAEHREESAMSFPTDCTYFFQHQEPKSKKKRLGFNVRKSFCRPPNKTQKNGTGHGNEQKELRDT